jgi:hypothetical protein
MGAIIHKSKDRLNRDSVCTTYVDEVALADVNREGPVANSLVAITLVNHHHCGLREGWRRRKEDADERRRNRPRPIKTGGES